MSSVSFSDYKIRREIMELDFVDNKNEEVEK